MKEKLFLIDGTALAYRAHFAFIKNPLINSKGIHTSAIFGVIKSFYKLVTDLNAKYVAISFDRKEPTFRHKLTETYKANRPPIPEELIHQIEAIKDFFEIIGIKEISIPGYEADDIIGSLSKQYENLFDIVIVSGDKDFAQLVNNNISLYDNKTDTFIKYNDIVEKYEIKPEQFIDYLAIVGDSADNIPGAKGIGPKGAVKLLKKFNNIDNLFQQIDTLPEGKEKDKLINSQNDVFLSKTLAAIKTDIDLSNINENYFHFNTGMLLKAINFLSEYELTSLKNSLQKDLSNKVQNVEPEPVNEIKDYKFTLISSIEQLKNTLSLCNSEYVAIDTETTSIDPISAELVGISFCFNKSEAYYIPIAHTFADNLDLKTVTEILNTLLENKLIIGHNIKYDIHILNKTNLKIKNQIFDTLIAAYILNPGQNEYSLDDCAKREFNYIMTPITDLIGKGKSQISFDCVDVNTACKYAAEDALMTFLLFEPYKKRLIDLDLYNLFNNIEIPLIYTLAYMEKNGVYINTPVLNKLKLEVSADLNKLTEDIYNQAGQVFNINSTQQLSSILFDKLGIKSIKKTKTGHSTDIEVLEKLSEEHNIAKTLIEYRQLSKLLNTYIEALPGLVNPTDKRIHTSFNQAVTSTGRLSSSNPNLQNIPIKNEIGRKIRSAFTAENSDFTIVSADYSQIELRLLAILSKDKSMIDAFKNNIDIHTNTASLIFNKSPENIDSNERRKAKFINFGIIYGMGAQSLSKELSISTVEAKTFIDNYFNHFPTIKEYMDKQVFHAHQKGWVETIYKRKLYLPNINSSNKKLMTDSERIAVNMPIQGSAADIIKIAMNNIYKKIFNNPNIKMLIQVHDELVFEVQNNYLNQAIDLIKFEMENALDLQYTSIVQLTTEIGFNSDWDKAH